MKSFLKVSVIVLVLSLGSFAQNTAKATHHTIKVGKGLKKAAHVMVKVGEVPVVTAFDSLEASVDALGVSLQAFADAVDVGIAAPLEALPKPLNTIGDGVHYVYEGLDAAGQFLAK